MMNQTSERRHSDAVPGYIQQWWWILRVSASSARSCLSHWQQQQYNNNTTTMQQHNILMHYQQVHGCGPNAILSHCLKWWTNWLSSVTVHRSPLIYCSFTAATAPENRQLYDTLLFSVEGLFRPQSHNYHLKGSMKERNMFHNYETQNITRKKPVMRQKTCNYIELFGSSTQYRYARRRI